MDRRGNIYSSSSRYTMRYRFGMLLGLFLVSAVRADDWPQWLGPKRDGVWRETGILETFPKGGPKELWRVPIASGYSGPAVADGRVFVTDRPASGKQERVICVDEKTGNVLWQKEYPCTYKIAYPLGPRCSPLVAGDKVY